MNRILLVGCGHMGSSLLKAWSLKTDNKFIVVDPVQHSKINKKFKSNVKAVKSILDLKNILIFDIVIFAIKPQIAEEVLKQFKIYKFKKKTIFVSIVAGKKIHFFNNYLPKYNQFIRVMPNMPAVVNQGMSCLMANNKVSKRNKLNIEKLFNIVGQTIWLSNESDIDKVTAISGSGPGYIFLFVDAFEHAALKLGLSKKITKKLVYQTFYGSINLLVNQKLTAETLTKNIAVKGGTTESGISYFKKNQLLHKLFTKVINASYVRSKKLGK